MTDPPGIEDAVEDEGELLRDLADRQGVTPEEYSDRMAEAENKDLHDQIGVVSPDDEEVLRKLVQAHARGEVTIRQISQLTGLSTWTTYELVDELYELLELGDGGEGSSTFTPDDFDDEKKD